MKKILIIIIIIFIILGVILFKSGYKNKKSGNNINDTDILNISSYKAIVQIEVYSNKNTNKYIMKQEYKQPNSFYEEVVEPDNFAGLTIRSDGTSVTLDNKKLDLKTLYENFAGDISNLSLMSFIDHYKNSGETEIQETVNEKIMMTKIPKSQNNYQMYQNLYIDKNTNLPIKMEILDINKNITVYILYNEIKLNK